jgi:ankyrin repeat protein
MALLVAHGLDANEYHSDGLAPLHRACRGNDMRCAAFLFYTLPIINRTNFDIYSTFAFCRHTEVVRVLLDAKTDPLLPVRGWFKSFLLGFTCAGMTNNEHTTELLEKYEAKARRGLHSEV